MVAKKQEIYDADFEGAANIIVDSDSVILQEKKSGNINTKREDIQVIYNNEDEYNKCKDKKQANLRKTRVKKRKL